MLGKMFLGLFGVLVCHVEIHVVVAGELHLRIDGACHHIAWRKLQALVVTLHEPFAALVAQNGSVASHGLRDEERGAVAGMEQCGGVELDELHVLYRSFGAVDHGYAVAGGYQRVGGGEIHGPASAGGHECHLGQEGVDLARWGEHICSVACDVGGCGVSPLCPDGAG